MNTEILKEYTNQPEAEGSYLYDTGGHFTRDFTEELEKRKGCPLAIIGLIVLSISVIGEILFILFS